MRAVAKSVLILMLLVSGTAVVAEQGAIIRAGELKEQPFIDAATTDKVAANQAVTVVKRQGGWVQVESNGKTGWVRTLNLRLSAGSVPAPRTTAASLLRTGSSGKTETTGVKGLGEEDIKNASIDPVQLELLATLAVAPEEAKANAEQSGLKENAVEYLKASRR